MARFNVVQRGERSFDVIDRQTGDTVKRDLFRWMANDEAELLNEEPAYRVACGVREP